jgi:hypothetical protein
VASGELSQKPSGPLRWDLLESQPPSGERLTARLAVPDSRDDVFIAVDAAGRRYVLVTIPPGEPRELAERVSRGVEVKTVEMKAGIGARQDFIEIACLEAEGYAALDTIALEMVEALQAGASIGRVRLVQNVLAKWRRFWAGVSQGLLSKEQQLGLFGELWFLCRWLTPATGSSKALHMWRGPVGARNDFEVQGFAIEAKTTGRLDAAHVIHGLEQLLEPPGGSLFLFSLTVRDEASGSETLPRLVEETRGLLADDVPALSQFESALAAVGYDDRLAGEYGKLVLRVRDEGLYRVAAGFPRLIPASLVGGLPAGVTAVTYELRLDVAVNWLIARTPAAAAALLADFMK